MLVLSRKVGEKIFIGNEIVVTVVRVSGDKVRIGVEAPNNVTILRAELTREKKKQGAAVPAKNAAPGQEN